MAREIGRHPDIIYVAFNAEEAGLAGSKEFVEGLREASWKRLHPGNGWLPKSCGFTENPLPFVQGVPTTGDFLGVVTNHDGLLDNILAGANTCNVPFIGLSVPDLAASIEAISTYSPHVLRSDHAPFWEKGIPAAMLTDTAEFRNPHYHQTTDTPDTLDYDFMAEVAKAVVGTIRRP